MRPLRLAALSLLLVTTACGLPEPDDLAGYADGCRTSESCAPGRICEQGHCVFPAGAPCKPGELAQRCEYTCGVCAGAQRACVGGTYEQRCSAASYGSRFAHTDTPGDGLDNNCDGVVDETRGYVMPGCT